VTIESSFHRAALTLNEHSFILSALLFFPFRARFNASEQFV
jgi:hypothetical protein